MKPRGFTLIEVLVALVVMSIMAGLSWQGMQAIVRTRDAVTVAGDRGLRLNTALAQWEQDLQSLMADAPVPAIQFDGVRLQLVRATPDGAQLVVWSVREGQWQRWAGPTTFLELPLIEQWVAAASLQGREPGQVTLSHEVQGWQLYFFRGNAWSNAQSTGDLVATGVAASQAALQAASQTGNTGTESGAPQRTAAAVVKEQLPQGVRLVMSLRESSGSTALTRDVLVFGGTP